MKQARTSTGYNTTYQPNVVWVSLSILGRNTLLGPDSADGGLTRHPDARLPDTILYINVRGDRHACDVHWMASEEDGSATSCAYAI
jgi:hypothetical protein